MIQDPVWERSFPEIGGITVPYADPRSGRVVPRLRHRARGGARSATSTRPAGTGSCSDFRSLGIEPVSVHTHDYGDMLAAFLRWADLRQMWRGARRVRRLLLVARCGARARGARRGHACPNFDQGSSVGEGVPLKAYATISPTVHLFGDELTAKIAVVADTKWVDPDAAARDDQLQAVHADEEAERPACSVSAASRR